MYLIKINVLDISVGADLQVFKVKRKKTHHNEDDFLLGASFGS